MKTTKFLAGILALIMILASLPVNLFAAEGDGTITIESSESGIGVGGKSFEIYQIFDAQTAGNNLVSYQWHLNENSNNDYYNFFYGENGVVEQNKADGSEGAAVDHIAKLDTQQLINFANKLYAYIKANNIAPTKTDTAGAMDATVKFDNLSYGFYLVYESTENPEMRAAVSLTSATPTSVVKLKVDTPTINKEIVGMGSAGSATVGDKVDFKITLSVPDTAAYETFTYKLTDKLPDALDYDESSFKVINVTKGAELVNTGDVKYYEYSYDDEARTITVDFTQYIKDNGKFDKNDEIEITYSTVLNDKALNNVAEHNYNEAKIDFSNDPTDLTATGSSQSRTDLHTFGIDVSKVASTNYTHLLNGAEFNLVKLDNDGNEVILNIEPQTDADGAEIPGKYKVVKLADGAEAPTESITLKSNDSAEIQVLGLGAGRYRLIETEAPAGYKLPQTPFDFTINATFATDDTHVLTRLAIDNYIKAEDNKDKLGLINVRTANTDTGIVRFSVTNVAGSALPETGGIGTTVFTFGGLVLMAVGAVYFLSKKRNKNVA